MQLASYKSKWDKISISASMLCALHCVALPIIFTTIPFFGIELIENPWVEFFTIAISMFIGGWAIYNGYKKHHHNGFVLYLFAQGIVMLLVGNLLHEKWGEIFIKLFGGASIIIAHIFNWRACKECELCNTKNNIN